MDYPKVSKQILTRICISFSLFVLAALGAAAALPGSHRSLAPQFYGLKQIGDNLFIDSSIEADKAKGTVKTAKMEIRKFFGGLQSDPKIIICTKTDCAKRFGGGPRGITYGYLLVKISPKGFNPMIITHELFHAELHKRMGLFGMVKPVIPVWFDEGMATYISKDPRYREVYTQEELEWVKGAKSYFGDWRDLINERGWKTTYGAARAAVKQIEQRSGPGTLRHIIDRVTLDKASFEEAMKDVLKSG